MRFDFTHLTGMTTEEIAEVESCVNANIRANMPLATRNMGYEEALKEGTT